MNLVLLRREELDPRLEVRLTDRRAEHLRTVLRVTVGHVLRVGMIDGPLGAGEVRDLDAHGVTLRCRFDEAPPVATGDVLILAIPRPRVLGRVLESAAALGFETIVLLRTWFVEHGYLRSKALDEKNVQRHLLEGLEQARRTRWPRVHVEQRFRPFVEDRLEALLPHTNRYVAHPGDDASFLDPGFHPAPDAPLAIAIGPERGFVPFELELLRSRGFAPVSLGPHPLRVETAVPVLHASLRVLAGRAPRRAHEDVR